MARSGSYLIRVGSEWALVSRLCPNFEIPFETRKYALTYAKAIGWTVIRKPDWDRVTAEQSEQLELLTKSERAEVRSDLNKVKKLRQVRRKLFFLDRFGVYNLITYFIKRILRRIHS